MRTNNHNFWILYFLLVIVQIIICNYCRFTPYLTLSLLPAAVICIPTGIGNITGMLIAAASGLAVDFFSEGIIGLNMAALVPVAFIRRGLIELLFGKDIIIREDLFSIEKNGLGKVAASVFIIHSLYLAIYIFLDGAGTRTPVFNLCRYACSIMPGLLLGLLTVNILNKEDRR